MRPAGWQGPIRYLPILPLAAYLFWLLTAPVSPLTTLAGTLGGLIARAAGALALLAATRRIRDLSDQQAWRFLGVGAALWAVAEAVAITTRWSQAGRLPLPSLPDWIALAGSLAALTGVAAMQRVRAERFGRVRELLDVAILTLAVAALAWLLFIRSALTVGLGDPIRVLWAALPPASDLVLTGLLTRLLLRSDERSGLELFGQLGLAALLLTASDLGEGYRRLLGDPAAGGAIESGRTASGLLMLWAAQRLGARRIEGATPAALVVRLGHRIERLLPIAFTYAVVGTVIIDWGLSKQVDWVLLVSAAGLSLLLMVRQGLIIGQMEMRQYVALINSSADLAFICDPDGRILLSNPAFDRALGWPKAGPVESGLPDILPSAKLAREVLAQGLERGWSGEVDLIRRSPPGSAFPAFLSLRPIQDERRSQPVLAGTAHDLTLVRRRELELRSALDQVAAARADLERLNADLEQKVETRTHELERTVGDLARLNRELQELDRLKSEFVALVSHELRAPLTNIRSGIEFILERQIALGTKTEDSLRLVQQESERLTALVESILDLSALEAGRFPLEFKPLRLAEVTRQVVQQFPNLERLRTSIPDDLPRVRADERGLKSILYHLLDNAVKYAPEGELQLEACTENGSVQVSLSDSGPGIPLEEQERVFEMFHRLDSRDKREVYGHGLGLPMARRLAEAMGGGIRVERGPRPGARVVFWLPRAEE
jgi:PAS domain S-box-containing protein